MVCIKNLLSLGITVLIWSFACSWYSASFKQPRVQADKQRERREKSCVFLSMSPLTPPGWSYQEWRPPSDLIWQSLDRGQSCTGAALHSNLSNNTTVLWLCFHCFDLNTSPLGKYSNVLFFLQALFMKYKLCIYFFLPPQKPKQKKKGVVVRESEQYLLKNRNFLFSSDTQGEKIRV